MLSALGLAMRFLPPPCRAKLTSPHVIAAASHSLYPSPCVALFGSHALLASACAPGCTAPFLYLCLATTLAARSLTCLLALH